MRNFDFWEKFCKDCNKRICCQKGTPMVLPKEKDKIVKLVGRNESFEGHHEKYFILRGKPCHFLKENGKCRIQKVKPLDCKAYPIFIRPLSNSNEWRIDRDCPASGMLPKGFIEYAKGLYLSMDSKLRKIDWKITSSETGFKPKKIE